MALNTAEPAAQSRLARLTPHLVSHVRVYLTWIWLVSFFVSLLIVNSYVGRIAPNGKYVVPPDDRLDCLQPLIFLYSAYLAGILAFWFKKPVRRPTKDSPARVVIALACTALFALAIIYCVSLNYLNSADSTNVKENVKLAVKIASALTFIVAPVNCYYFGMKSEGHP
jgi:hypothetical protein